MHYDCHRAHPFPKPLPALLLYSRMSMAVLCMVFTALSLMAVNKFASRLS